MFYKHNCSNSFSIIPRASHTDKVMRLARRLRTEGTAITLTNVILVLVLIAVAVAMVLVGFNITEISLLEHKYHRLKHTEKTIEEFSLEFIVNLTTVDQQIEVCCAIENQIIADMQKRPCTSFGILNDDTGCSYSSNEVLHAQHMTFLYWARYVSPANMFYFTDLDWSRFESGVQEFHYATTLIDKINYPALQAGIELLMLLDSAIALDTTTDLERAGMKVIRQEVKFTKELLELNFPHSQYAGNYNLHPVADDFLFLLVLPSFAAESDYDTKILLYMQRLLSSKTALIDFYLDILAYISPPQVEQADSCVLWTGLVSLMSTPTIRDALCDVMTDAAIKAQCYLISAAIDTESTTLATVYTTTYCDAAQTYRPATQPGLGNVFFGNETYYTWLRYMTGLDDSIAARFTLAQQLIDDGSTAIDALMASTYPGSGFADWVTQSNDLENPRFTKCFDTIEEVGRHFEAADSNVSRAIVDLFQYRSRSPFKIDSGPQCCFYVGGTYNEYSNLWSEAGAFIYAPKGVNNADQLCVDLYVHSIVIHEGQAGHGLEVPLYRQRKCTLDRLWTSFSGYHEGWATYTELQCDKTTLCDDPNEQMFNLYWTTLGAGAVLKGDIELNSHQQTYAQCVATNEAAGSAFAAGFCTRSADIPGQLSSYSMCSRVIENSRVFAETELGGDYDAAEFNMLITKFSEMPWDELALMVETYVLWRQDREAALAEPWGDTIDKVLRRSTDPVVGTGFTIPGTNSVLINSDLSVAQTNALAIIKNNPTATQLLTRVADARKSSFRS